MKKESIFDLLTGVYLLACGVTLTNAIGFDLNKFWLLWKVGFDFRKFGILEDTMKAMVRIEDPISAYVFMPVLSEFILMFIFVCAAYFMLVFNRKIIDDIIPKSQFEGVRKDNIGIVRRMLTGPGLLLVLGYASILFAFLADIPRNMMNELISPYFLLFLVVSTVKIVYSFIDSILFPSKNDEQALRAYLDKNRGYLLRSAAVLLILIGSILFIPSTRGIYPPGSHVYVPAILPAAAIGYYFIGGIFFLGLFAYETIRSLAIRSRN